MKTSVTMERIQTSIVLSLCVLITVFSGTSVKADVLSGDLYRDIYGRVPTGVTSNDGRTYYVAPFYVSNHTTGQDPFIGFCGDGTTLMSGNFFNASVGVDYGVHQLSDVWFYSDFQKQCLQDLFDYAYGTLSLGEGGWNVFNAMAFQFAIWEIQQEDWANNGFNITSGAFSAYPVNLSGEDYAGVINMVNNWLSALTGANGITWESLGLLDTKESYDLTVYVAEGGKHVSQTIIAATPNMKGTETSTTPEPATLAIFGLAGLGGLALRMRRR
ncbi:MAG: PEP-CTERM sorting domain-containing protein [Planctomycetaceae bacterium]|nr:PEP-CTERM sorting domain-containing protein [Planctomycetaceae bacterium]